MVGLVDNVVVFERETYEIFIRDLGDHYKIEKAVRLNLKDYKDNKHVDILRITTKDGVDLLVISDTLKYQTHVPFQTLLLPMRVKIFQLISNIDCYPRS